MSDTMPPITLDDMIEILENRNFKTYLVLGEDGDGAWELAKAAQNMLAGVRSYLVKQASQRAVRNRFEVAEDQIGIVFGRSTEISTTLDETEANDFLSVTKAISAAT